jgi:hypothetical protein
MRLFKRFKRTGARERRKPARRKPPRRRTDPDWTALPGGSSAKEAAEAPPGRAGELAD